MIPASLHSQPALKNLEKLFTDIGNAQTETGRKEVIINDSVKFVFTLKKGILQGPAFVYYPDGRIKAKGEFCENLMSGKWVLFSNDGKMRVYLSFHEYGKIKLRRIRKSFLRNPVRSGNGSFEFHLFDTRYGIVSYKNGMKHGKSEIFYADGSSAAVLNYQDGLFDGECTWIKTDGRTLEAKYDSGKPIGVWEYQTVNGDIYNKKDFNSEPYSQKVTGRMYVDENEVLFSERSAKIFSCHHSGNKELFDTDDSGNSIYTLLQNAFIHNETVFYSDVNLEHPIFPDSKRMYLSGLEHSAEKTIRPVMICIYDYHYFSHQLSFMSNMVLQFNLILEYSDNDTLKYTSTPYAYFPMVYEEIGQCRFHDKPLSDFLIKILNGKYFSIPVYHQNLFMKMHYEVHSEPEWIEIGRTAEMEKINILTDLWLHEFGVIGKTNQ